MAVVVISSASSRALYEQVATALGLAAAKPTGLVSHSAGEVGDRVRIVEVWESRDAADAFAERLVPAILAAGGQPSAVEAFDTFDYWVA